MLTPLGQSSNSGLVPGQGSNHPPQQALPNNSHLPTPGRATSPNGLPRLSLQKLQKTRQFTLSAQTNSHDCTRHRSGYERQNKENLPLEPSASARITTSALKMHPEHPYTDRTYVGKPLSGTTARIDTAHPRRARNGQLLQSQREKITTSAFRVPPKHAKTAQTYPKSPGRAKSAPARLITSEPSSHTQASTVHNDETQRTTRYQQLKRQYEQPLPSVLPITERESLESILKLPSSQLEALSLIVKCKCSFERFKHAKSQSPATLSQTEELLLLKTLEKMNKQVGMNGSIKRNIDFFESLISKIDSEKTHIYRKLINNIKKQTNPSTDGRMIAISIPF